MGQTERWTPEQEWDAVSLRESQVEHELERLMAEAEPTELGLLERRLPEPRFRRLSPARDRPAA